jgi:ribose-phosphate pyrophosphokinase
MGQARLQRFPDTEVSFQIDENIRGTDVFVVQPTSRRWTAPRRAVRDDRRVPALVGLAHHGGDAVLRLRAAGPQGQAAGADLGQARGEPAERGRGTNRVLTMDLHKAQIQGFFDIPVDHLFAAPVIIDYCSRLQIPNLTIVSPDAGGAERARAYAKRLGAELAIVDKRRSETGRPR